MARATVETIRLRAAKSAFGEGREGAFRTAAEGAPFMIRSLGLGAGIASLAAKEGEPRKLAGMIAAWLFHDDCPAGPLPRTGPAPGDDSRERVKILLDSIARWDRAQYRTAQVEALGYAVWLKRLAQAFCDKGDG